MFQKVLIANRGEIAVRIIRTCRDLGILTVAIFSESDRDSLHVRLADECYPVTSELRYGDKHEVLEIAQLSGADAIHPGYGFLAEEEDFAQMCADVGITFIGPSVEVISRVRNKIETMRKVAAAGFRTPSISERSYHADEAEALEQAAAALGYPLVIKSCKGGRGRGERVVMKPEALQTTLNEARREALMIYGNDVVYLERVIAPSHHISVPVIGDDFGSIVHLGEVEGSLTRHNQKLLEESPAPSLSDELRSQIYHAALAIAHLVGYTNVGSVEFLVDSNGLFYFTEVKARILIGHPIAEMVTGVDLVAKQLRCAAGEALELKQDEIDRHLYGAGGYAMQVRVNAEDPWRDYLPSPGTLERYRLPGGVAVRVDTYGYVGGTVPVRYDSLLAKVVVKGRTRAQAILRLRRALEDFKIVGVRTNLPLHLHILNDPDFAAGKYDTGFLWRHKMGASSADALMRRDLAAAAAVAFALRHEMVRPVVPDQLQSGWHRSSRTIPG
jgi:acetyl/propionyl-CoA carboxylase alpha subunit